MTSNKRGKEWDMSLKKMLDDFYSLPESKRKSAFDTLLQWHKEQRKAWALGKVPLENNDHLWADDLQNNNAREYEKGFNSCREQMIKNIKED